tara:strand:- start:3041 stop:3619 length:579 start_codon:yes stop_codon:yes gene_type:complete
MDKLILTDVDGVLLNWEYAFNIWMQRHGYKLGKNANSYDMGERYDLTDVKKRELVKYFNESAAIGYLPPLRDSIHYVRKLHEEQGFVFHILTALSTDHQAQDLRRKNLQKLFGETVFEKFIYCDTGADKDEILAPYTGSGLLWIEDKLENAELGQKLGLEAILIEHGHNMDNQENGIPLMKDWKAVYEYVVG